MPSATNVGPVPERLHALDAVRGSALMLGTVSGLSNLLVPRGSILVMYVLMTLILLWRPRGLMGHKSILEL